MSHDTIDEDAKIRAFERGAPAAFGRNQPGGCGGDDVARARYLTAPSVPISGASPGDWPCRADSRALSASDVQDSWRCDPTTSGLFRNEQFDVKRDCDTGSQGIFGHDAPAWRAWLTVARGILARLVPNFVLIVCSSSNCNRPTRSSSRTAYVLLPSHRS
jgi:hypothetical protein